jgi:predicted transcriptional regulator of viral defense system
MTDIQEREQRLYEIAEGQGGYFTAKQALKAGYSYRLQHYHAERGNWMRVDRGIFRLRNYPSSDHEELVRWSLWSHNRKDEPQIVFSHQTALALHGIGDVMPAKVHFSVPQTFRKPIPGGCVVHRVLSLEEVEHNDGFLMTTPLRTLLDVSDEQELDPDHLKRCFEDALKRGLVRTEDLRTRAKTEVAQKILDAIQGSILQAHGVQHG